MAAVVERVHGPSFASQPRGDVLVAAAVLAGAVSDDYDRAWISRGQPRLPEDRQPADPLKTVPRRDVRHVTSSQFSDGLGGILAIRA